MKVYISINRKTFCWNWTGSKYPNGYGMVYFDGKKRGAHRVFAHLFCDFDISSKLCVCHHCDNPACVNPNHLFIGTHKDNTQDMMLKNRYGRPWLGKYGDLHCSFGRKHTKETRKKISESNLGNKLSFEVRNKMSKSKQGQKNCNAKINDLQASVIRKLKGKIPRKDVSKIMGVSLSVVDRIFYNQSWTHI